MTLIAAFRCYEGVVLCADDQETIDSYFRVKVDKLEPAPLGNYEVAAAGTGNVSELIDGFIDTLRRDIELWPQALIERQIQARVRKTLVDYFRNEVRFHPSKRVDKYLQFVICLRDRSTRNVFLFETANTVLHKVRSSSVMGFWASIYQHEIDRLYDPAQRAGQVILLGIHIFDMARKMTNVIGENVKIVVATEHGMKSETDSDVKELQNRFEQFDKLMAQLATTLPNLSEHDASVIELLAAFEEQVINLRADYRGAAILSLAARLHLDPSSAGVTYSHLAEGTTERIDAVKLHDEIARLRGGKILQSPVIIQPPILDSDDNQ